MIFDTKVLDKNHIELTLYQTSDATSSNLTFEIFAGSMWRNEDVSFEKLSENRVKITIGDSVVFPRFFIRVYGEDSDDFMSKFISQEIMFQSKIADNSDTNQSYYLFSHQDWKKMSDFTGYGMNIDDVVLGCRALTGNPNARKARKEDVDVVENNYRSIIDSANWTRKFYGVQEWYEYSIYNFTSTPYTVELLENTQSIDDNITDSAVGLMCVTPFE